MTVQPPRFDSFLRKGFATGSSYRIQPSINFAAKGSSSGLAGDNRMIDFG
jgi:hypothetical protein